MISLFVFVCLAALSAADNMYKPWEVCQVFTGDADEFSHEDAQHLVKLFAGLAEQNHEVKQEDRRRFLPAALRRLAEMAATPFSQLKSLTSLCKAAPKYKTKEHDKDDYKYGEKRFCFKGIAWLRPDDVDQCNKDLAAVEYAARWLLGQRCDAGKFSTAFVALDKGADTPDVTEAALAEAVCSTGVIPCNPDTVHVSKQAEEGPDGQHVYAVQFGSDGFEALQDVVGHETSVALVKGLADQEWRVRDSLNGAGFTVGELDIANGCGAMTATEITDQLFA